MKTPGIVVVVAILNFFSSIAFFAISAFSALAIVFGAAWGIDTYVANQISQHAPSPNFSYGLMLIFGTLVAIFLLFALFFLVIGIGLLRGSKYAWYLQIAMSVFGLLGLPLGLASGAFMLPIGAVFNILILVLFFQAPVRDFFKA